MVKPQGELRDENPYLILFIKEKKKEKENMEREKVRNKKVGLGVSLVIGIYGVWGSNETPHLMV